VNFIHGGIQMGLTLEALSVDLIGRYFPYLRLQLGA
jgi:hypothetical protein